ncbi:nuclease-related domain-containing protein [Shewanella vesiculosa]|uniref:Nuclease-related domain-containing protein n=1 Tax=Shewanella vesiculosa TaxID=518738 RepID=A0ABV0FT73_9GAMM
MKKIRKSGKSLNRSGRVKKRASGLRSVDKKRFVKKRRTIDAETGDSSDVIALPEYYQIVFSEIHNVYRNEIYNKCVLDSKSFRRRAICKSKELIVGKDFNQQYDTLQNILSELEDEMKSVIKGHSVFFWLHLYRRIAPCLSNELGANTSEAVTVNVRQQVDQAIKKFGSLSNQDDYALSSEVDFDLILGGLLSQSYKRNFKKDFVSFFERQLKFSRQFVLTDFSIDDVFNIYYVEGLSYQYWYISAKMRSLGKGVVLSVSKQGDINEERTKEQERLILDFDRRNEEDNIQLGIASNVGTYTASNLNEVNSPHEIIVIAYINAFRYTAQDLGLTDLPKEFSPNYIPWFINANDFYKSHSYLSKRFIKKFGFGLLELLQFAGFFSNYIMSNDPSRKLVNESMGLQYHSKFQRGYCTVNHSAEEIKSSILKYYSDLKISGCVQESELESQIDAIFDHVFLNEDKQNNIGIWSRGPQYVLIGIEKGFLCDSSSWHFLIQNMFYGLQHYDPKSIKGHEFEFALADILKNNHFDVVMNSFVIRKEGINREIDVAVRIRDNLYLFECKASERPLNFDIGNPKTISSRIIDFKKKLEQAESLTKFVLENKVGNNYDLSWAESVNYFVVSPFTEWVWDASPDLWTECKRFPRLMSVHGAIKYLTSEKSKLVS